METNKKKKRTFAQSFRDAFRGIGDCLKTERNMRVHLVAACYVLFFAYRLHASRAEFAVLCLTIGAVMAAELLNTSVEKLCDFAQKQWNPRIRVIKDLAAGAVLVTALAALLVAVVVMLRPELWGVLVEIVTTPAELGIFLFSLLIGLLFVFLAPEKLFCRLGSLFSGKKQRNPGTRN